MDTYDRAFKKACEKFDELKKCGEMPILEHTSSERLMVKNGTEKWFFPYVDLKPGDACLVEDSSRDKCQMFYNGERWATYLEKGKKTWALTVDLDDLTFIKKLGYNILEDKDLK